MTIMDRWLLVMADVRIEMAKKQITNSDVEDIVARHSTGRCEVCTSRLCCDNMRLSLLTWGALHAATGNPIEM